MNIYENSFGGWTLQADDGTITLFDTEQEAMMAQSDPLVEWAQSVEAINERLRAILRDGTDLSDFYMANGLYPLIVALAPGELLPGTAMTRERALLIGANWQDAVLHFAGVVVGNPPHGVDNPPTRKDVILARR